MHPIHGVLVENRVIVWDIEQSRVLFGNGYYGKPLGVPKPKGIEFDSPLILDLMEGCYLSQIGKLEISNYSGRRLSSRDILAICKKEYANFQIKYLVFKNLRDSGYIVSPGLKFGCDFAVYEQGPGIDHAPYLVQVSKPTDHMNATGIVLFGRLATTVKKQFILAIPRLKERKVDFIGFDWWRA
jgi:tRNA-intron endonuclease, archaea type